MTSKSKKAGMQVSRARRIYPSRRQRKRSLLTPQQDVERQRFDDLVATALDKVREAEARGMRGVAAYDQASNVFKREVYRLVRRVRASPRGLHLIDSAVAHHCAQIPRSWTLEENPFFWALKAISANPRGRDIKSYQLTRLSQEMLYADRHGIKSSLLIGFLMQTGFRAIKHGVLTGALQGWYVGKRGNNQW